MYFLFNNDTDASICFLFLFCRIILSRMTERDEATSWSPLSQLLHIQVHKHTQGLGFRSEAADYNMFITLQSNCGALIKHTHMHTQFLRCLWTAEFLLKIDLQAVVCRCFAEEFITSLPCTAVSRMRTHTIYAHSMPASNPNLPN